MDNDKSAIPYYSYTQPLAFMHKKIRSKPKILYRVGVTIYKFP